MPEQLSIHRLSELARGLAGPTDEAGAVARTVVLASELIACAAVDLVRPTASGGLAVLASTDANHRREVNLRGEGLGRRALLRRPLSCSGYVLRFHPIGALPWLESELQIATAFAHLADVAIDRAAIRGQALSLAVGLESNRMIGTAIGILMTRCQTTYEEAFESLRACSQRANRKLRQIADEVILTGELPDGVDCSAA